MDSKISYQQLKKLSKFATTYCEFADDYIVVSFDNIKDLENIFKGYTHISALSICFVKEGSFSGSVGLDKFEAAPGSIVVVNGSKIFNIDAFGDGVVKVDIVFFAPSLLHDINIDPHSINLESMLNYKPSPIYNNLSMRVLENFRAYFTLLRNNTSPDIDPSFAKNIARSLVQAIFYQMFQMHSENHIINSHKSSGSQKSSTINYVHDFMMLLQMHHTHHRSISFYADKLFISPKYLSSLIKKSTGRSAAEWIDQFVINEAKNMLRFSNKNIQQISIALNFSTQSAFGKYFKHFTGMSPTEYQKT